jgi:hypothetical protein
MTVPQVDPVKIITIEQYREALRTGKNLDPSTFVLVPVADFEIVDEAGCESVEDAGSPFVYEHLLYFGSLGDAEEAKQTLLSRRPRIVKYQDAQVRKDEDGDVVLILTTAEQLSHTERVYITRAVKPAFKKFNMEASTEKVITLIQMRALLSQKLVEAESDSERATKWHAEVLLSQERETAFAHVSKAATQATLLQSLLDQIDGKSAVALWDQ